MKLICVGSYIGLLWQEEILVMDFPDNKTGITNWMLYVNGGESLLKPGMTQIDVSWEFGYVVGYIIPARTTITEIREHITFEMLKSLCYDGYTVSKSRICIGVIV